MKTAPRAALWLIPAFIITVFMSLSITTKLLASKQYMRDIMEEVNENLSSEDIAEAVVKNGDFGDNIDEDTMEEILEESDFSRLLTNYGHDLTNYLFDNGKTPKMDTDEIYDAVRKNRDEINDAVDEPLTSEDWDEIYDGIDDFTAKYNKSIKKINKSYKPIVKAVNIVCSSWVMYIEIGILVLILVRLVFLYWKYDNRKIYKSFRGYAIIFGINLILSAAVAIALPIVISAVSSDYGPAAAELIRPMMNAPLRLALIYGISTAAFIVLAVITSVIFKNKDNNNTYAQDPGAYNYMYRP